MSVFKCKMCGGTLEIKNNETVAVCEYCGTKQTLPKLDDDRKANLYDRANHFRRNNEFDKAMGIYEQILNSDNTDAESYWSLVLCRYGIEYVEDPATHKRIPTVNRAQYTSIFDDEDYKSALQYADSNQKDIYEAEAVAINEIQKGILAISQKEEPFDVFICYKETDTNGRRTPDSVLATELYHELTREGFKVFFSRITLEDKLGQEYEPYIFAALNSAKVMVVLGTKPEYFNAVWVKNEWNRYLALIKNGARKVLIPAYKDMDPYDLPEEFSHLQAQDMSKLGFMQDLIRGIKKLAQPEEIKKPAKETSAANVNTSPLLKRAFMFLEDGDFERADDFCEQVLNQDPENAQAYLGKLMAELRVKQQADLANCAEPFDSNKNYQKAVRFADSALSYELKGYIATIKDRNARKAEEARKESLYLKAMDDYKSYDISRLQSAINAFTSLEGYKDSDERIHLCQAKIDQIKIKEENDRIERERLAEEKRIADEKARLEKQRQAEIDRIEAEKRAKRNKKIAMIVSPIVIAVIAFVIVLNSVIIPNGKYNDAITLMNDGKYSEAISAFEALDGYMDSEAKIYECKYNIAVSIMMDSQYQTALSLLEELGDYKDCADKIIECKYNIANDLFDSGNFDAAYNTFITLESYKDSSKKVEEILLIKTKNSLKNIKQGDYIKFGKYEQDNNATNGQEDIDWLVLEVTNGKALIISKYVLDAQVYNTSRTDVTWESCSLRKWLNNQFWNLAFSSIDKQMILATSVSAHKNPDFNTNAGNTTKDNVFILSITEATQYFSSDKGRTCTATKYAKAQGAPKDTQDGNCGWWLRTPGVSASDAARVLSYGAIDSYGYYVDNHYGTVRPVIWIDIS